MATARVYCHRVSVAGPADRQLSVCWWQRHSCGGHLSHDYRHIATYIQQRYQILYILQQSLDTVKCSDIVYRQLNLWYTYTGYGDNQLEVTIPTPVVIEYAHYKRQRFMKQSHGRITFQKLLWDSGRPGLHSKKHQNTSITKQIYYKEK